MITSLRGIALRAAILGALLIASAQSHADMLNLNYTATSPNGVTITNTVVNATVNVPAAQSQNTYSHVFNAPLNNTVPGLGTLGYEFYDDYVFNVAGSSVSSITATIDLGNLFDINNLNVRLFSWDGTAEQLNQTVTIGSTSPNTIQAWTFPSGAGEVAVINKSDLADGTYVLQVRGNVDGVAGGSYVGTLNVAPVPLPAAFPLLLTGLGMLRGVTRRRVQV